MSLLVGLTTKVKTVSFQEKERKIADLLLRCRVFRKAKERKRMEKKRKKRGEREKERMTISSS